MDVDAAKIWTERLGVDSPLQALLPRFRPRREQQAMAEVVANTLAEGGVALVEAGTGTGKSFAYLLPACFSGRKVLVSTASRALQDQILDKDLPLLFAAWPQSLRISRLKGRSNYLCPHRLQQSLSEGVAMGVMSDLLRVADWASQSREGDIGEVRGVSEDSPVWPLVTSTRENCLGGDCPEQARCPVLEARRRAQEADLVVVNHHLLLSDLALKAEGRGDLLPRVDALIIDEAHALTDLASQYFGQHLSSHQLLEWLRDCRRAVSDLSEFDPDASWTARAQNLESALQAWLGGERSVGEGRREWRPGERGEPAFAAVAAASEALLLALPSGKGDKILEQCRARGQELLARATVFAAAEDGERLVRWLERRGRGLLLHSTPLDLSDTLQALLFSQIPAVVLTSATLRVGGSFDAVEQSLGLQDNVRFVAESPFDYAQQSLLYLPEGLPEPSHPHYTAACVEMAIPVIEASAGRCFFLFTSHRALQEAAGLLAGRLSFPLLVQGQAPRSRLLEQFRQAGNGVLLGAASFWEGVDVQGEALSTVIIDKLPFANPGDPVLQARIQQLRAQGGDPFSQLQMPQAVIALRQGVGRLIRSEADRGVLMLCDPRLRSKGYGRVFLRSLPPMPLVCDLATVQGFWQKKVRP